MTPEFQFGLGQIVVSVGTSLAKTHEHYAKRLKLLTTCWKEVNATEEDEAEDHHAEQEGKEATEGEEGEGEKAKEKDAEKLTSIPSS